jgi:hypothetical protein
MNQGQYNYFIYYILEEEEEEEEEEEDFEICGFGMALSLPTSGSLLPFIFFIHVRSGPIYWGEGGGYLPCKKNYR